MDVKEMRARLAAFDDHVEVYVAPELAALKVGEGKRVRVAHPIFQHPVTGLHVVGDIDRGTRETRNRRVVMTFKDPVPPGRQRRTGVTADAEPGKRFSGSFGPMGWDGNEFAESNLIRVQLSGLFSIKALDAMYSQMVSEGWIEPGKRILIDDRLAEMSGMTETDLIAATEIYMRHSAALSSARVAIIPGSLEGFRKVCQFELIVEARTDTLVHGFFDEREAIDWLLHRP